MPSKNSEQPVADISELSFEQIENIYRKADHILKWKNESNEYSEVWLCRSATKEAVAQVMGDSDRGFGAKITDPYDHLGLFDDRQSAMSAVEKKLQRYGYIFKK